MKNTEGHGEGSLIIIDYKDPGLTYQTFKTKIPDIFDRFLKVPFRNKSITEVYY